MEPVRWGVLGCARVFERRMVPGFRAANDAATLLAVASRSREKAESTTDKHQISRAYDSYEKLLADPDIEAVYIPLPNDQHCAWTLRALEAGKHVLCDKPAALTYGDARRMAEAAEQSNRRLAEGFMWRLHPQHARVQAILQSGELGAVSHCRAQFTYSAAPDPGNIRYQPERGGGAFLDTGVYPVNAARFFWGEPEAVFAASTWDASGVDRQTSVLLHWADGRTASLLCGFDLAFASRFEFCGDRGGLVAERAFQVGENGVPLRVCVGEDARTEHFPHVDQYGLEIAHFSRCVRDEDAPLAPLENGLTQARVVEAVIRSARENRRVTLREIE